MKLPIMSLPTARGGTPAQLLRKNSGHRPSCADAQRLDRFGRSRRHADQVRDGSGKYLTAVSDGCSSRSVWSCAVKSFDAERVCYPFERTRAKRSARRRGGIDRYAVITSRTPTLRPLMRPVGQPSVSSSSHAIGGGAFITWNAGAARRKPFMRCRELGFRYTSWCLAPGSLCLIMTPGFVDMLPSSMA